MNLRKRKPTEKQVEPPISNIENTATEHFSEEEKVLVKNSRVCKRVKLEETKAVLNEIVNVKVEKDISDSKKVDEKAELYVEVSIKSIFK